MKFFGSRMGWTGTFSKDIGSKRDGCVGGYRNETYLEPCPPDTWSNGTWKVALGPAYHQYWNERRIRRNLGYWTDPAFGKYTMLEAKMDAAEVPPSARVVNPSRLRRAFEVFQGMFPERPRWALTKGLLPADEYKAYPDGDAALKRKYEQYQTYGAVFPSRFFHFYAPTPGWQQSSPAVSKAFDEARKYLGLRTQAMLDAWYAKANALIAKVPGGEDNFNVQHEWNMILVNPGSVEVHPWIFQFLDLFGRSQLQIGVAASQLKKTAPKLSALVAKK